MAKIHICHVVIPSQSGAGNCLSAAWVTLGAKPARGRRQAHNAAVRGMQQQVLDWLDEFESGAESSSHRLEAVSNAVQQDPAALATLVREGGLAHLVALAKESASGAVATILVVASEEYAQELVEANALTVIVRLVNMEENQEDAAWALGNLSAHADIADAMITCGALRTAASPCGPGAAGARPGNGCAGCWWCLCCRIHKTEKTEKACSLRYPRALHNHARALVQVHA